MQKKREYFPVISAPALCYFLLKKVFHNDMMLDGYVAVLLRKRGRTAENSD